MKYVVMVWMKSNLGAEGYPNWTHSKPTLILSSEQTLTLQMNMNTRHRRLNPYFCVAKTQGTQTFAQEEGGGP